ncbi:TPA: helix-turn-helix domain-containing protein [Salmonella enterica subsp. enterica serovar Teltow]|nr:helix-turn-helix domain-containing protein [Salmonella enterica subsp. enterica serovar Chailey]HBJ6332788.1 helix-turn-helix domain-containing protein [Salmonella enterica subsp. enterica serovar Teltow]
MVDTTNKHQAFADRLNAEMRKQRITVRQLSTACGVTYEMARRYTLGTAKPRGEKMAKIAEWLNVPPSWLDYGGDEQKSDNLSVSIPQPETEIGEPDEFSNLSEDEKRLLRAFRRLPYIEARNMMLAFENRFDQIVEYYRDPARHK